MRWRRLSLVCVIAVAIAALLVPGAVAVSGPVIPYDSAVFGYPHAMRVDIEDDLAAVAYAADSSHAGAINAIVLYDITDPAAPVALGTYPTPGPAWDLQIEGPVLYEARDDVGFVVWDIGDPANASVVVTVTTPGDFALHVEGDTLYVGDWDPAMLYSYDVSDPSSPVPLDSLSVPGAYLSAIDAYGDVVYVGCRSGGAFSTIDATDPSDLSVLDSESADVIRMVAAGGIVYTASSDNGGLTVWDATTPTDIKLTATRSNPYYGWCIAQSGTRLYLGGGAHVVVYDVTAPTLPQEMRRLPLGTWLDDIAVSGSHLIAAADAGAVVAKLPTTVGVDVFQAVAGASRYDTAIRISQEAFPYGSSSVVITTGQRYPDALGGAVLAGMNWGPTLLTDPYVLQDEVLAEIRRLAPRRALILGGKLAVSGDVEDALVAELGAENVIRISGDSRYHTAANIALEVFGEMDVYTVFVASGANFPDALAAGPLSTAGFIPIVLTYQDELPAVTADAISTISPSEVIVLGGSMVVSDDVVAELEAIVGAGNVTRLWGDTRYATAAAIAQYGHDKMGLSFDNVAVATGERWADALAGGVLQGTQTSVLLLTRGTALSPETSAKLAAHGTEIGRLRYLGGTSAISQDVRDACESLLP